MAWLAFVISLAFAVVGAVYPIPPPPGGSICVEEGSRDEPRVSCDCWHFRGLGWWWRACPAEAS